MALKVIGIYSSPRANGNSDLLLKQMLRGATEAGSLVEEIFLRDLCFSPCTECGSCNDTGRCTVEDDMQWVYSRLECSDRVIIASPVFFYSVPAQLKAMIDRGQALWCKKAYLGEIPLPEVSGRKGFLLSVAGTKGQKVFDCSVMTIRVFFDSIGIAFEGYLGYRQIDRKGAVLEHPTALAEAFEAGKRFCRG